MNLCVLQLCAWYEKKDREKPVIYDVNFSLSTGDLCALVGVKAHRQDDGADDNVDHRSPDDRDEAAAKGRELARGEPAHLSRDGRGHVAAGHRAPRRLVDAHRRRGNPRGEHPRMGQARMPGEHRVGSLAADGHRRAFEVPDALL